MEKQSSLNLPEALRRALSAPSPLLQQGDHVLVAVSGGPDSLALLHALHLLRSEMGLRGVAAAHFHHGLREQEADDDAAFVADFCAARGIACIVARADVAREAAQAHVSIQQAARAARYGFLARAAQECGANKIATAHTQDDQAETVLMNVLRGTGTDGLRGIPARRGQYVRPLLGTSRADTEAYCAAHALLPRRDSSNSDPSHYTRNRVRHALLPLLEQDYHPGTRAALLRLSQIAAAESDFLHAHAETALREVLLSERNSPHDLSQSNGPHCLTLSRARLQALHPALLPRVLRAALGRVRGTTEQVTFHHCAQIAEALQAAPDAAAWGMTTPAPCCRIVVRAQTVMLTQCAPPSQHAGKKKRNHE